MTPQRSGPSRLGIASCIAAVLAPVSSVISLLLMATVPDTYPPEMPEPGVIHLMIGAAYYFAAFAAAGFLLGLSGAVSRTRRRLFAWLGLGLSSAELALVLGLWQPWH
ncbi:MAG: hypothetical protein ACO3FK_11265 [Vulcanococcus sp.]|jgi:hypothetical protein